jgi:hypothetical protein
MKSIRKATLIAPGFLALVLLAAPALARAEESAKDKSLSKNQRKYDADHDGKLSDEEKVAAKEGAKAKAKETREANLAKYDANKNGKLDDDERAQKKADEQAEHDAHKAEREAKKTAKEEATK